MTEFAAETGGKLEAYRSVVDYLWQVKQDYPVFLTTLGHCANCAAGYGFYNYLIDQNLATINGILDQSGPTIAWHKPDGASMSGQAVEAYFERDKQKVIEIGFYAIDAKIVRTPSGQVPSIQVPLELIETLTETPLPDFSSRKSLYLGHGSKAKATVQAPIGLVNNHDLNHGRQFAGGATIDPRSTQLGPGIQPAGPVPGD